MSIRLPTIVTFGRLTAAGLALGGSLCLAGCINLAPRYQRPAAPVPAQWPSVGATVPAATVGQAAATREAAAIGWQEFFQEPRLRRVVAQALAQNRDLRIALLDIRKARATYRIQRAEFFPSVAATGSGTASRSPASVSDNASAVTTHVDSVELGFSAYELDMFGRLRNLKDEALESYLATEQTARSTQLSLVAEVANDWLTMAADQSLLGLARATLQSQQATLDLVRRQHALGSVSGLELAEAEGSVASARKDVATYITQLAQDRDALRLVVGADVVESDLPDGEPRVATMAELPAGVPSSILQQRPDVQAAEHTLKSANADIGAARAAFFPAITLTAAGGTESNGLSGLFKNGSRSWSFAPSISLPIFNAGSNRASLDSAKAERDIELATYEKTLQTAFQEVSDALATRATIDEQIDAQDAQVRADQTSYDLSMAIYRQGSYSLLDTLTAQRTLYEAQQTQVSTRLSRQTNLVTLYKVLGGGWSAGDTHATTGSAPLARAAR